MSALGSVCLRSHDFSPVTVTGAWGDQAEIKIPRIDTWSGESHAESKVLKTRLQHSTAFL